MALIHSSYYRPIVFPEGGTAVQGNIDRAQDLSISDSLNREKIEEIGRDGAVGYKTNIPDVSVSLTQLEYGTMAFWNKITNTTADQVTQNDFKTALFAIASYMTDDDGTYVGTSWQYGLRTNSFAFNIGDPDANTERSFEFVGNDDKTLLNSNKYLIYLQDTYTSGQTETVIGSGDYTNYPDPVIDPDTDVFGVTAQYLLRVVRVRSGVATVLTFGTDFTYDSGTKTFTPTSPQTGDTYNIYYSAASYITGSIPFTENDSDASNIPAENVSIYLTTTNYVYRLQSVSADVSFDRQDIKEIGNSEVVSRGVSDVTCSLTLGRVLESYSIEEILAGKAGEDYGIIDIRNFTDNNTITIKIYSDATKSSFVMGYKFTGLTPTTVDNSTPTSDYIDRNVSMEGETFVITSNESNL